MHLFVVYANRAQVAAKKPVLLEKPVALNVKELETMMAAAAENGVFIWVRRDTIVFEGCQGRLQSRLLLSSGSTR